VKKYARYLLPAAAVIGLAAPSALAKDVQWEWSDVPRIIVIGDIHGAYDNLVAILKNTGLVNDELDWIGGKTHLVQMGDVVDRGPDSRKCMDLLMDLEKDSKKAGGYTHVLIGNHEAMNIVGILDHTSREEFASYDNPRAREAYERAFELFLEEQREEVRAEDKILPPEDEVRKVFEARYPPGYFGHRLAFSPQGEYGKWITGHNVSIRVNGIVFSHGDWSEEVSEMGIEEFNERVRDELSGKASIEEGVTFHLKGPLQYRGLSHVVLTRQAQEAHRQEVDRILANLGGTRLVVGHTTTGGTIEPRFGGKHISVDVGMLQLYMGGHQVALEIALEIEGSAFYAVHPGGKVELPDHLDETNYFEYLEQVAAVDPKNINVHLQLVDEYLIRGQKTAVVDTLEHLYQIDSEWVPFRYRRILGDIYDEQGQLEKAREQHVTFIAALKGIIESNPENPHLKNTLARFCVSKNLALDLAEESIRDALRQEKDNPAFLLTLGRLQMLQQKPGEAAHNLERAANLSDPSYDIYYHLGLAYLALDNTEKARDAFELATKSDPNRPEAQEELRKIGEQEGNS
jgi:hypothetical protein